MTVENTIDHGVLAASRIATQYRNSPNFKAFIQALMVQAQEIEGLLNAVALISDIETAEGVNLDVIGEIVGISRIIPAAIPIAYFGFDITPSGLPFGDEGNPSVGGRFYNEGEDIASTSVLGDPEYRILILAKIVKNHSHGTVEDVLAGLKYIFVDAPVLVEDNGAMAFSVYIGRALSFLEKSILTNLDILPRPAGVRINVRGSYNSQDGYLGFEGQPGAVPFAEEGYVGPIGHLMEEF